MQLKRSRQYATGTQLYVWGCDSHGQLGLPQTSSIRVHNLPKQINVLHNIRTVSCGEKHLAFITHEGDVFTQGCNADGKLGIDDKSVKWSNVPVKVSLPLPAIKVHCGMSHTLCILDNGDVYAWGFGQYGALGIGQFKTKWKPTKVYLDGIRIKHISAGAMHSSFISMNGDLYMCGSNDYGELGSNRKEKLSVPTLVHTKSRLVEASCGIFYTLLLDEHGRLYAMGNNKYGQLGTGSKNPEFSPILIKSLENEYIVKVESGYHSGALNDKGDLFLWGSGTFGEYLRPTKVKKPYPFIDLSIGGFFGAAIDNKHNVYSWGNNNSGQLGLGHFENCKELTEISFLRGKNIDRVFCGVNFVIGMISGHIPLQARSLTPQLTSRQRERSRDDRLERQSLNSQLSHPQPRNIHSSMERDQSVQQLRNTIMELQQNERHLLQDRKNLQLKLETLAADYERLSKKYDMIEIIVNEKEKIISIYDGKIRELSKNSAHEEVTVENKLLKHDNKRLTQTIERNAQLYAEKLKAKDDIIIRLQRTEAELIQQTDLIKNQLKLSQNLLKDRLEEQRNSAIRQARSTDKDILLTKYETLLKQKDKDIVQLSVEKDSLQKELARETADGVRKHNNLWHDSSKIEALLKIKEEEEIGYIRKINKLESQLKEREEQLTRSERRSMSPRRPPETGRLDNSLVTRQLNEELRLKDETIHQLTKDLQLARLNGQKAQINSSSLTDALRFENQQLRDQLILKEQLAERFSEQLRVKQQSHLRMIEQLRRSKESGPSEINNMMSTIEKKYVTTFRNMDEISLNLNRQLEKQIQLSTKLKSEVDQLNFQLKRTQKELDQLKMLWAEKEKSYQAEIQRIASQKHKDEISFESRVVESVEQQYLIKGIQDELERTRAELDYEKEIGRKNEQSLRKLNEDNINLRKALSNTEGILRVSQDEAEVHRNDAQRNRRFKKQFEAKQIEYIESQDKIEELNAKLELVSVQLTLKNKALKDVEKQLKDQIEAAEHKETEVNFELRKLRQAKNKLTSECKQHEQAKLHAVQKMQSVVLGWERQKEHFASVQRKADATAKLLEKERSDMQALQNEITEVKKEATRTRMQRDQLGRNYEVLQTDYRVCQQKCRQWEEKTTRIQKEMQDISIQMNTNKDENRRLREQLNEKSQIANELKNVNSELISANSEFARNEVDYVRKIEELQRQIVDIRSQNDDYNPRFEALIQRNKELDERNAELANMLNKAIERQATEYKEKVLSDVAKNAGNIYEHLKESVVVSTNKKRKQVPQQSGSMQMQQLSQNKSGVSGSAKSPQQLEQRKEDPYKRMMSAKITDHKRRISESAFKLVELLDVEKDSKNPIDTLNDYQRINDKMESIEAQKSSLLNKINSYAERLKIL